MSSASSIAAGRMMCGQVNSRKLQTSVTGIVSGYQVYRVKSLAQKPSLPGDKG
ncbi:hypothetical protein [Alteromonas gilva]|uniref:Uncharacterized protein n=1 Tax=Alteromonas gilva TaxID=2987522 RepID=A0ABT5L667_9ALTE|nr:hypothetical protein [Alteromonas gilva]MDC8832516.1 hypothetical protein [Alteromonas gilva]